MPFVVSHVITFGTLPACGWVCCRSGFAGKSFLYLALLGLGLVQLRADVAPLSITASSNPPPSSLVVSLSWNPSPSPTVKGYLLNWGLASGQCTNKLDVGNVTNTTVSGLATNATYYFNLVAYNNAGDQAPPSNEIAYRAPANPWTSPSPTLSLQLQSANGTNAAALRLSFQGNAGLTYTIQATADLQQWATIWTTNCLADGAVVYSAVSDLRSYPRRFYRLLRQ